VRLAGLSKSAVFQATASGRWSLSFPPGRGCPVHQARSQATTVAGSIGRPRAMTSQQTVPNADNALPRPQGSRSALIGLWVLALVALVAFALWEFNASSPEAQPSPTPETDTSPVATTSEASTSEATARLDAEVTRSPDIMGKLAILDRAIESLPHADVVPVVEKLLDSEPLSKDRHTRFRVLERLGPLRDDHKALERLVAMVVKRGDNEERGTALGAIGKRQDPLPAGAREKLEAVAKNDPEGAVRRMARDVLARIPR
jgi:hypothetical protein